MQPGVRIAAASCVLLGGLFVAMLFRRDTSAPPPEPRADNRLLLPRATDRPDDTASPAGRIDYPSTGFPPTVAVGENATILMPAVEGQTPPEIAETPPSEPGSSASGWGPRVELPPMPQRPPAPRTHRIVDGDTLDALAARYLGTPDRRGEIFEANRDVLPSPELLPIGAELKIPPSP